ncbi:putative cobalbumin biosynthesis protein [Megalodesulfovibrio gigas DSM 1382 = ATCC 19364]|uniref:Adenosylcobinamide kinase n=2 Tax=Megalodesulfovibrio gigas TaxID=879 RepID=T2G7C1_MEGG1|nr:putative cobalbumin biosynthesis protein [Megalodesulfovibrio gigas DSM 1382 = ATCC 19364]
MHRLVLGGEKSGKSAWAMARFLDDSGPHRLLVTGKARDLAFRQQIERHRQERAPSLFVEEVAAAPQALPLALERAAEAGMAAVLVDSVDFWLFAAAQSQDTPDPDRIADRIATAILRLADTLDTLQDYLAVTLVSCETGLGPIAADAVTRRFVRSLGACNQALARCCEEVVLVAAGLPLFLKQR